MSKVIIYTDGAAEPNPGFAGWGVVLECDGHKKELYGGCPYASNNAMEITAAIEGLKALKRPCEVVIYSDSQYVVHTMTKGWKRKANHELWAQLDALAAQHTVEWVWVRGHDGNPGNERADQLSLMGVTLARGMQS
jgi:ribonuclease HI